MIESHIAIMQNTHQSVFISLTSWKNISQDIISTFIILKQRMPSAQGHFSSTNITGGYA